MLYVLHVQTEVEDECENHCELPAIYADRTRALARAKSEALGIRDRILGTGDDDVGVVDFEVGYEVVGYRVVEPNVDCWHATVEVMSVGDVDLTEDINTGCQICGGPSH